MDEVKNKLVDDKIVRWFLRTLTGSILTFYTFYIIKMKLTTDVVPLDNNDWAIVIGTFCTWAVWEGVRKYLNNRLSKM